MVQTTQPSCVFLAVCNEIIEDSFSHNKTLVNMFDKIGVNEFPSTHARTGIFASLQGVKEEIEIKISITSPDGKLLLSLDGKGVNQNPPFSLDFSLNVGGLHLPSPGNYTVEVSSGGTVLAQRTFAALPMSEMESELMLNPATISKN